jgi:hypothetical protein
LQKGRGRMMARSRELVAHRLRRGVARLESMRTPPKPVRAGRKL